MAKPLIEGLRNELIVRTDTARQLFPQIEPVGYQLAVQRALAKLDASQVETIDAPQALVLRQEPKANVARYDTLRGKDVRHAS